MGEPKEKYGFAKAENEAAEMQELINSGKAKDYSEAEKMLQEQLRERELSSETIEKIMSKAQDIDAPGVAYTLIDRDPAATNFEKILQEGLLGRPWGSDYEAPTKESWARAAREQRRGIVYFNITGQSYGGALEINLPVTMPKSATQIGNSYWTASPGSVTILFDMAKFKEIDHPDVSFRTEAWKGKINTYHAEYKSHDGKVDDETGFHLSFRVAPRFFNGIVINPSRLLTPDEREKEYEAIVQEKRLFKKPDVERIQASLQHATTRETDPSQVERQAQEYANRMLIADKDKTENLIPIYDIDGNLWWPKKMSHQEILEQMTKDKEDSLDSNKE